MEFICVLSVSGSLASYQVSKEGGNRYKATLRSTNEKRTDIPAELLLQKNGAGWESEPWHEEIVTGLTHAIESSS